MQKSENDKHQTKSYVQIKSKVHPNIFHKIQVDLYCYERMPDGKKLQKSKKITKAFVELPS